MLKVNRDGTKLIVLLEHGLLTSGGSLQLEWDARTELLAEALVRAVNQHLDRGIEQLRKDEYLSGYRDHTRRLPRREVFCSDLSPVLPWMKERRS